MATTKPNLRRVPDQPEWSVDDALNLRNFLDSTSGRRSIEWLRFLSPQLLDGSDVNRTLVASGEVKGYNSALDLLFMLTRENPSEKPEEPEAYPSLDDDSKWDGKETREKP